MDPQTFAGEARRRPARGRLLRLLHRPAEPDRQAPGRRHHASTSSDFPVTKQIKPELMQVFSGRRRQGLRPAREELLARPALQPRRCSRRPASTRTARRRPGPRSATAAKKIAGLGNGTTSATATTARTTPAAGTSPPSCTRVGGDIAVKDGDTWKAAFNNEKGKQVLQQLKDMRWTDNSHGRAPARSSGPTCSR